MAKPASDTSSDTKTPPHWNPAAVRATGVSLPAVTDEAERAWYQERVGAVLTEGARVFGTKRGAVVH